MTLAVGLTAEQKYRALAMGYTGVTEQPGPLNEATGLLAYSGQGKSHFLQSIPGNFIFNCDPSSIVHVPLRAHIWPLVTASGDSVEPSSADPSDISKARRVLVTWPGIMERVATFIEMARDGFPGRPKAITLDTADAAYRLVQKWMVEDYNEKNKGRREAKESFRDLGQGAWDQSYQQIVDKFILPLRQAGYGVFVAMQLWDEPFYENMEKKVRRNQPQVPDKLYNAILAQCAIVMRVERFTKSKLSLPAAGQAFGSSPVEKSDGWKLVFRDENDKGLLKTRAGLPNELEIPQQDPYSAAYEPAYKTAMAARTGGKS